MSDNVVALKPTTNLPPDFITRVDINNMTDQQLDELIEGIKARRMTSFYIYEQTQADLAAIQEDKARAQLEKNTEQVLKALTALDKNFTRLETLIFKMRGLRIQAGLNIL